LLESLKPQLSKYVWHIVVTPLDPEIQASKSVSFFMLQAITLVFNNFKKGGKIQIRRIYCVAKQSSAMNVRA